MILGKLGTKGGIKSLKKGGQEEKALPMYGKKKERRKDEKVKR